MAIAIAQLFLAASASAAAIAFFAASIEMDMPYGMTGGGAGACCCARAGSAAKSAIADAVAIVFSVIIASSLVMVPLPCHAPGLSGPGQVHPRPHVGAVFGVRSHRQAAPLPFAGRDHAAASAARGRAIRHGWRARRARHR